MAVVLVAGGATGIGRATVRALRAGGNDVYLADTNMAAADEVAAEEGPGMARAGRHDLSDPTAPREAVEATLAAYGSLDAVVVTAGVHLLAPVTEYALTDWELTMAVNVRAPFLFAQAAAGPLAKSSRARLIFTGSTSAFRGGVGSFSYAASKGALVSMVRALAVELAGSGIRVNCVCPGWIDTPFNDTHWARQSDPVAALAALEQRIPLGRQGEPEQVAAVVSFLVSPESDYVTGQSLIVDGGLLSC
jgi:NAD(P)-dependent dehydrogenase (short-subunit alcohol dehydrogenase family)